MEKLAGSPPKGWVTLILLFMLKKIVFLVFTKQPDHHHRVGVGYSNFVSPFRSILCCNIRVHVWVVTKFYVGCQPT